MCYDLHVARKQANPTIGQVVGEQLARLRIKSRLTQEQIVAAVREHGLAWTVDTVSMLEAGRRANLSVPELLLLAQALNRDPWRWFPGEGDVQLTDVTTVDRAGIRNLLGSRADRGKGEIKSDYTKADHQTLRAGLTGLAATMPDTEAELHAAETLHAPVSTIKRLAMDLWGWRLDLERDRRIGEGLDQLDPDERRARRGHVTRALLDELRNRLPPPAPKSRRTR